jgi:hypothetical protein
VLSHDNFDVAVRQYWEMATPTGLDELLTHYQYLKDQLGPSDDRQPTGTANVPAGETEKTNIPREISPIERSSLLSVSASPSEKNEQKIHKSYEKDVHFEKSSKKEPEEYAHMCIDNQLRLARFASNPNHAFAKKWMYSLVTALRQSEFAEARPDEIRLEADVGGAEGSARLSEGERLRGLPEDNLNERIRPWFMKGTRIGTEARLESRPESARLDSERLLTEQDNERRDLPAPHDSLPGPGTLAASLEGVPNEGE